MSQPIVVLDGFTTTPLKPGERPGAGIDEVTWEPLETLGALKVYDRTAPAEVLDRVGGAGIVLTNKTKLGADAIGAMPGVKYIGVLATGVNVVDVAAATERGITVCNVPGYSTDSVAQHACALLLELVSRVGAHNESVRRGAWSACADFAYTLAPITELAGKTLGIVGAGEIGLAFARIGRALGMKIAIASRTKKDVGMSAHWMSVDALFAESDVVSLHCPLTPDTDQMVDAKRLSMMKRPAILINTGRGQLIDELALAKALAERVIAGAGLDVLSAEPPAADNPLLSAPNCVITPHIAWASTAARRRLLDIAAGNVAAFLEGNPRNVVSP